MFSVILFKIFDSFHSLVFHGKAKSWKICHIVKSLLQLIANLCFSNHLRHFILQQNFVKNRNLTQFFLKKLKYPTCTFLFISNRAWKIKMVSKILPLSYNFPIFNNFTDKLIENLCQISRICTKAKFSPLKNLAPNSLRAHSTEKSCWNYFLWLITWKFVIHNKDGSH